MKFLFLVTGLGEAAQGLSLALSAREKGVEVRFAGLGRQSRKNVADRGFEVVPLDEQSPTFELRAQVDRTIEDYHPDVIFCCNSKTTGRMFLPTRDLGCLIVSLDSNWLFEDMPAYFDAFFVVFPREIYETNSNYVVDDDRVRAVGFIPSGYDAAKEDLAAVRKRLGIEEEEKAVFAYFGRGETFKDFLLPKFLEATDRLRREGRRIRTVLLSDREVKRDDVVSIKWLARDTDFDLYLRASSCLVSHHGMGTLSKAIRGNVPIISFVPEKDEGAKHSMAFEVEPFEELGLCATLPYSASPEAVSRALDGVLFGEEGVRMRAQQAKYAIKGEEAALREIDDLLGQGKARKPGGRALLVYDWFGADLDRLDTEKYVKVVVFARERPNLDDVTFVQLPNLAPEIVNTVSCETNMARAMRAILSQYYDVELLVSTPDGELTSEERAVEVIGYPFYLL